MIRKKGRLRRQLVVLGSAFGSTGDLARGLWRGGSEQAADDAARHLPVRDRLAAGPRRRRRGAGAVHLFDLLTLRWQAAPRSARLPGLRRRARRRAALRTAAAERNWPAPDGIPRLRLDGDGADRGRSAQFYNAAPFPGYPPNDSLTWLRTRAERSAFARLLDASIPGDARIVEVGCGTGQMSLYLARADRMVVALDLVARRAAARRRRRRGATASTRCASSNATSPACRSRTGAFDLVYCSGVLHHTPDPRAAVRPDRQGGAAGRA